MSQFVILRTIITNKAMLLAALKDLGFSNVEVHEKAQHLYGYQGDRRVQTAEVIIRRKYVGSSSNDIGFKQREDGTFEAIVSEYDSRGCGYGEEWLNQLTQRYAYHATRDQAEREGLTFISEDVNERQEIRLRFEATSAWCG